MKDIKPQDFTRIANNFYNSNGLVVQPDRIAIDSHLINYFATHQNEKKFKVAFVWICLNPLYWQYAKNMIEGAKMFFLPGHETDYFLWSDMPELDSPELKTLLEVSPTQEDINKMPPEATKELVSKEYILENVKAIRSMERTTIFPTEAVEWPLPTLMRYHLFLQQEELLKDYDYIFYSDVDMHFVGIVGDEILGEGLTVAPHPGYVIRKELWPPYEPNDKSACFINRPGVLASIEGKPRFMPYYAAGGLQGGRAKEYIKAMKETKKLINKDIASNYYPIWNDETAWNKYLFDILPKDDLAKAVFLTPSYVYPDSLIKEYYEPIVWGQSYPPKLVTLTKRFTTSSEGADMVKKMVKI